MNKKLSTSYTATLPSQLYTCEQTRHLDALAIKHDGLSGITLMKRAARAAFSLLTTQYSPQKVIVLCGGGNNAGDGYLVAALAKASGLVVNVLALKNPTELAGDALTAYQFAIDEGVTVIPLEGPMAATQYFDKDRSYSAVIVDALLGTGFSRQMRAEYQKVIDATNQSTLPVLSLDLPSGVNGNTGAVESVAVKAHSTISFVGLKQGLLTGVAPNYVGQLYFADLGISESVYQTYEVYCERINWANCRYLLPLRKPASHKGESGQIALVGGDESMCGAIFMATKASARVGAGLLRTYTRRENVGVIVSSLPEAMVKHVDEQDSFYQELVSANAIVVGPGLGRTDWSKFCLTECLKADKPTLFDADALNLIADSNEISVLSTNTVITPHPGEAARLLGVSVAQIQQDRFHAARALQSKYQCVVVLKGAGTIIAAEGKVWLANVGNAGMASAGMGDILAGTIGSFMAQGLSALNSAKLGVVLHGEAGDHVAKQRGQRGMLATDLIDAMREIINEL